MVDFWDKNKKVIEDIIVKSLELNDKDFDLFSSIDKPSGTGVFQVNVANAKVSLGHVERAKEKLEYSIGGHIYVFFDYRLTFEVRV